MSDHLFLRQFRFVVAALALAFGASVPAQNTTVVEVSTAGQTRMIAINHAPPSAPNQPPFVALTAPQNGAVINNAFGLVLLADAHDTDGSITKVEFFSDGSKLGEAIVAPWQFAWNDPPVGSHVLTAQATDDAGAMTQTGPVQINVVAVPAVSTNYSFETGEGFATGPLLGQGGWVAGGEVEITNVEAHSGGQSLVVLPPQDGASYQSAYVVVAQPENGQQVRYFDFWIKPATEGSSSSFKTPVGASIRFSRNGGAAELIGSYLTEGGEQLWTSGLSIAVDEAGRSTEWHRLTIRQDFRHGSMDVYLDGRLALVDLYHNPGGNRFDLFGHAQDPTYLDTFQVLASNPLFADLDQDGMDDAWEAAHGLDPSGWDRLGDRDHDTLTNIQEYALGTDPGNSDTDGDGLPDDWERAHGFDPLLAEAGAILSTDTDGDGLTLLEEGKARSDAQIADTDGDGVNDRLEAQAGWNPLEYDSDVDGDGVPNDVEIANGSNPVDYYNGQQPVVTSLGLPQEALLDGQFLAVLVSNVTGDPLVNAPVTFKADTPDHGFSPTPDGKHANARSMLRVRTDAGGIARVYVVRADELLEPVP